MERIWDIQWFSWGESDDIYRWAQDSFYSAESVEIRKNLSGVELASAVVDTGWTIDGNITCMKNLEEFGLTGIVVCTDTGKIYLDGTLKTTLATGTSAFDKVLSIGYQVVSGTKYIYYISSSSSGAWKVHRSTTDLATFIASHKSYSGTQSLYQLSTALYSNGTLYFNINNSVYTIDTAETLTTALTLWVGEWTTAITEFQNNIKIYSNLWSTGVLYIWNGTESAPDYRVQYPNSNFNAVVNNGAFDYAVCGLGDNYNDLYIIQGTQRQPLRVNLENSTNSRIFTSYMSVREDIVYISGGLTWDVGNNYWVYTYGSYYPGTPASLVQQYSNGTRQILFHTHWVAFSYFATNNSKVLKIDHANPPATNWVATTGYVVTQMHEWNIWEEKSIKKINIGYKLGASASFKLYARKEMWDAWTLLKTADWATYNTKKGLTIYENEIKSLWFGNCFSLQYKIELLYGGVSNTSATPVIKRITTFMDIIKPM